MPLAVLSIDLEARLAKFEQDMGKATRLLEKLGDSAGSSVGRIGEVFAGSFIASAAEEGLKRLIDLFPQLIDGVAKFQDLAEETGASAEGLARMQTAADVSGVSIDTLAGQMVKLTSNLSKLTDDSKGAGQALQNLGIPIEEFRKLSPDEQIAKLSAAFNTFADGSAKTSNALALFGKSGAQVLKFFKEFGDGSDAAVRLTNDQIAAADAYGDAQARTRSEFRQTAAVIAVQFLPAVTAITGAIGDVIQGFVKAGSGAKSLRDDKSITLWALDIAQGFGTAVDAIDFLVRRAVLGAKTVGAAALAIKEAFTPQILRDSDVSRGEALSDLWKAYSADVQKTLAGQLSLADKIKARADAVRATLAVPESLKDTRAIPDGKPDIKPVTVQDKAEAKAEEAFRRFMEQIEQRKVAAQAELDTGEKLSEAEKFRLDLLVQIGKAEKDIGKARADEVRDALSGAVATIKLNEAQRERLKLLEADTRATAAQLATQDEANRRLTDQIEEIGLSASALDDLRIKRLELAAAAKEEQLATLALFSAGRNDLSQKRLLLDALNKEIDLRKKARETQAKIDADPFAGATAAVNEYLDTIAKTGAATRDAVKSGLSSLEDDLTSSLATGKFSIKRTVDLMIAELLRLQVVRPLLKSILGDGSGASGFFANLFGGSRSGGSGNLTEFFGSGSNFALGAAFGASGVIPHATGSVVNGPRFFAAGGTLNVMGEAGPEGILPLKRGKDGKLGVTMAGGGQPVVVHNVTNLTLSGDPNPATLAAMQSLVARNNQQLVRSLKQGTVGG